MGKMRWYKRDPDAALNGMAELSLAERGAYNTLIDLLYSRDGNVSDDDIMVARMIRCHWREWRTIKASLVAKGKVHITPDGKLMANRVAETIKEASERAQDRRKIASGSRHDLKNPNEINVGAPTQPQPQPDPHLEKKDLFGGGREGRNHDERRGWRHGDSSRARGTIFIRDGTEEWRIYAEDFEKVRGAQPIPDKDGGYWFMLNGEAARPPQRQHKRAAGWR